MWQFLLFSLFIFSISHIFFRITFSLLLHLLSFFIMYLYPLYSSCFLHTITIFLCTSFSINFNQNILLYLPPRFFFPYRINVFFSRCHSLPPSSPLSHFLLSPFLFFPSHTSFFHITFFSFIPPFSFLHSTSLFSLSYLFPPYNCYSFLPISIFFPFHFLHSSRIFSDMFRLAFFLTELTFSSLRPFHLAFALSCFISSSLFLHILLFSYYFFFFWLFQSLSIFISVSQCLSISLSFPVSKPSGLSPFRSHS